MTRSHRLLVLMLVGLLAPFASASAASADAICNDGTYSDADGQGACSWHDGVREWLDGYHPTSNAPTRQYTPADAGSASDGGGASETQDNTVLWLAGLGGAAFLGYKMRNTGDK